MQANERYEKPVRYARFESFERRETLSAEPVGDFLLGIGEQLEQPYGEISPALADAHELTGVNHVHDTYGLQGQGQTVAVIDSGIAYDHAALGQGFGNGHRVVGGWDFAENDSNPYDDGPAGFHGTHVAGIVGSDSDTYRGVAPGADLVALRVFDDQGRGTLNWVESALQWVHTHRSSFANPITTVNLSLGSNWNSNTVPSWAQLEEELAQLERDGIFIAVAAGNSFADYQAAGLSYPAVSPYVVPVASVDNSGSLSSFSQRDARVLAAPGRSITSTVPDYIFGADGIVNDFGTASGTSMASPYVAGAAVLVREAMQLAGWTGITQDRIYDHLRNTADVLHDTATNADYFRIDVGAAIDALLTGDDYGSSADAAYDLGSLRGETAISGRIESAGDQDFFTFAAAETGRVQLNLQATGGWTPALRLVGVDGSVAQGVATFDAVAGRQYTFAVAARAGTGSYDVGVSLASSTLDLGRIDFARLDGRQLTSSESWFQFTASRDGLFTAEAFFARGAGALRLQLYSDSRQLLADGAAQAGLERLDATVVGGGKYLLRISGSNADVDLRLTNLVAWNNGKLTAYGTSGADAFTFSAADTSLSVNGVRYGSWTSAVRSVSINGLGGTDSLIYGGSAADERLTVRVGNMTVAGPTHAFQALSVENVQASGGAGRDTAWLYDSAGDDRFVATPESSVLAGGGFRHEALGFEQVFAYSTAGGTDAAELYDSAGNDVLRADPTAVSLSGATMAYSAQGFDRVTAYATRGGDDTARFYDSAGDDAFTANATTAQLLGTGFANTAQQFERVLAYATRGGYDTARLDDSSGDDTFFADSFTATLSGRGFTNSVQRFERVSAYAANGGYDVARLYDSTGNDTLTGDRTGVSFVGSNFRNDAYQFDKVYANATRGGRDVARLPAEARDFTILAGSFTTSSTTAAVATAASRQSRQFLRASSVQAARQYVLSELESQQAALPSASHRALYYFFSSRNHDIATVLTAAKQGDSGIQADEGRVDRVFASLGA